MTFFSGTSSFYVPLDARDYSLDIPRVPAARIRPRRFAFFSKIVRTVLRRILPRALTVENELKPRVGADALAKFMYPELTLVTAFFVRRWLPSVYRIDLKLPTLDSRTMILVVLEQLV